jgi:hypothetical protein
VGETDPDVVYRATLSFFLGEEALAGLPSLPPGADPRTECARMLRELMAPTADGDFSGVSDSEMIDGIQYFLFPNWIPWVGIALGIQYRFRPNGDDHTTSIMDVRLLLPGAAGATSSPIPVTHLGIDQPFAKAAELAALGPVLDQDVDNLGPIQQGMLSARPGRGPVFSNYQESRIRHLHKLLDDWMSDTAL